MFEEYIGVVKMFAGNFAPRGYAICDGRLLKIKDNQSLFSIIGNMYGGDGRTTFALPDLRGRMPVGIGNGQGLSTKKIGEKGGQEATKLEEKNMPAHSHTLNSSSEAATSSNPKDNFPALSHVKVNRFKPPYAVETFAGTSNSNMNDKTIGLSGQNEPFDQMPPYLGINFIICIQGYYPARS
ncbi:phage tail protein [Cyclobacterium amurskyense]|uniref:phage tail protein n=1 Tax=Cyclobacterium amurskyense TaxID=320787 RepID=UPI0030DBF9DD|tara:strand:+ start:7111 stop:7656 length:546 start_codon:yes stop_codon:yes gene_type:complete